MSTQRKIDGFTRMASMDAIKELGLPSDFRTRVGFARCDRCGKVIQSSGLGIGSHRRSHKAAR